MSDLIVEPSRLQVVDEHYDPEFSEDGWSLGESFGIAEHDAMVDEVNALRRTVLSYQGVERILQAQLAGAQAKAKRLQGELDWINR